MSRSLTPTFAALLAGAFVLAACGGGTDSASSGSGLPVATQNTATPSATPTPSEPSDPYAAFDCGKKDKKGWVQLCNDGWVIDLKMEENYFGYAKAQGLAGWTYTGKDSASVTVILSRNGADWAQMRGFVSHFNGNPQFFNLTSVDKIDSGKYQMRLEVVSY